MLAVCTTVGTREDARRLARVCVEQKLAACVQLSEIESFYEWNGALQHEGEVRLVCKTTEDRYPALEAALLAAHPYALPAVFALKIEHANPAYGHWVNAQTASGCR